MPPRKRKRVDEDEPEATKKLKRGAAAAARKQPAQRKMPPPLPAGEVLTDLNKTNWTLGNSVGKGGFGEIYTAIQSSAKGRGKAAAQYVIKLEPHENGPLFTELSFYRRAAKPESIAEWIKSSQLDYLAVPQYIASGLHVSSAGVEYRFMVMERFGEDIEKLFCKAGRKFGMKTVCYLALRLLEALEYLHESEYVHADIKGSNLLTGYTPDTQHQVYLVDYGLAYRYGPANEHKDYKPDPRRCHDGTIEFTSIDAHDGANPSRRGDIEILGYCLLQWACGVLPWEGHLQDKPKVANLKRNYKTASVKNLMNDCFVNKPVPVCLEKYMECVYHLSYKEKPNYENLKKLFLQELKRMGMKDNKVGLDWIGGAKREHVSPQKRKALPLAEELQPSPAKKKKEKESSPPKRKRASPLKKKTTSPLTKKKKDSSSPTKKQKSSPQKSPSGIPVRASKRLALQRMNAPPASYFEDSSDSDSFQPSARTSKSKRKKKENKALETVEASESIDGTAETAVQFSDEENDADIITAVEKARKRGKNTQSSDKESGSDVIPGVDPKAEDKKTTQSSDEVTGSDIIPGVEPKAKAGQFSDDSDIIISGIESKANTRKRGQSSDQETGSDIIPGVESKASARRKGKTLQSSDQETGSDIIPGIESKASARRKGKTLQSSDQETGSDIIPGIESRPSANGISSSSASDIIPGYEAKSRREEQHQPAAKEDPAEIIPKGHYPPQLGYNNNSKATSSKSTTKRKKQ